MSTKLAALAATLSVANAAGPWASKMDILKAKHMLSTVPIIPNQFYAEIHDNVTGNVSAIPDGVSVMKQWYDYTNKRVRKDFDDGTSKIYDYKTVRACCFFHLSLFLLSSFLFLLSSFSFLLFVSNIYYCFPIFLFAAQLVDPGNERKPPFPSPQGFKFNTNDIENSCCWLWLLDSDTGNAEEMSQLTVESNAKDVGKDAIGEHWSSVKTFPFLQTDDWWFKNGVVVASNSYVDMNAIGEGYFIANSTWFNVTSGSASVPDSVFAHPDSRPTFGKCKQCGVDDECPMWQCMQ